MCHDQIFVLEWNIKYSTDKSLWLCLGVDLYQSVTLELTRIKSKALGNEPHKSLSCHFSVNSAVLLTSASIKSGIIQRQWGQRTGKDGGQLIQRVKESKKTSKIGGVAKAKEERKE